MNPKRLAEAVQLGASMGYVFIATASGSGRTHLAAARTIALTPENHVAVSDWFCPETMQNVRSNSFLSIVAWDAARDYGFQILGELEEASDVAMLDGYVPELDTRRPIPQVERWLLVHVDKVVQFKIAPQSLQRIY